MGGCTERDYGADDENLRNHIYFNCSDYSNQSSETCETWRIIGIVDGKVKIIRNSSIGDYEYDLKYAYCDENGDNCYVSDYSGDDESWKDFHCAGKYF